MARGRSHELRFQLKRRDGASAGQPPPISTTPRREEIKRNLSNEYHNRSQTGGIAGPWSVKHELYYRNNGEHYGQR
jgi:hypothetical protein